MNPVLAGLLGTFLLSFSTTYTANPVAAPLAYAAAAAGSLGAYLMGLYTSKPGAGRAAPP